MSEKVARIGSVSLSVAILGLAGFLLIGVPSWFLIASAVLQSERELPIALAFYGFFGLLELCSLMCGLVSACTRSGRLGISISSIALLLITGIMWTFIVG
jgi:hypothetical protein